jgi:hypothetical protein
VDVLALLVGGATRRGDDMRLCVTGSHLSRDEVYVKAVLDAQHAECPIDVLLHGKADGVDMFAEHWARANGIEQIGFQAEWRLYGRAAGPIRNKRMLSVGSPDLVLAFPSEGPGTADCVRQARQLGIKVREVGK